MMKQVSNMWHPCSHKLHISPGHIFLFQARKNIFCGYPDIQTRQGMMSYLLFYRTTTPCLISGYCINTHTITYRYCNPLWLLDCVSSQAVIILVSIELHFAHASSVIILRTFRDTLEVRHYRCRSSPSYIILYFNSYPNMATYLSNHTVLLSCFFN